jgi:hypothetical protein
VVSAKTFQPLPAFLSSFKATYLSPIINLNWVALQEINLNAYNVEWSTDAINFTTIAVIVAKGNATNNQLVQYNFQHKNFTEQNYYRLKMMDNNGTYQYSSVIPVSTTKSRNIQVYPNPANDFLTIQIDKPINTAIEMSVIDATGKPLMQVKFAEAKYQLNVKNLATGLYTLQLIEAGVIIARKKIIISTR